MREINLLNLYPKSKRPIEERGNLISNDHRRIARKFGKEFFDGNRLYGYGGYYYHERFWRQTVKRFRDHYQLKEDASILDVGCAKGFMLHDFKELMPHSSIAGIDVSEYAIQNSIEVVRPFLQVANAKELPFDDHSFDLVISINTVHNLPIGECKQAIMEIERVSREHAFITVDAWRNNKEKIQMLQWNLTALTYMHVKEWEQIFRKTGYQGDYYWFIAE